MVRGSGTTLVDLAGDNNAMLSSSGVSWTNNTTGKGEYVLTLSGGDAHAPNISEYSTDEFTAAMWVKPSSFSGDAQAYGFFKTSTDDRSWRVYYNSRHGVWSADGSSDGQSSNIQTYSATPPQKGQWVCLVTRYDGKELNLFKDKLLEGAADGDIYQNNVDLYIGNGQDFSQALSADVDEFHFWPRALSDSEIRQHVEDTEHRSNPNPDVQLPHKLGGWIWYGGPCAIQQDGKTYTAYVRPGGDLLVMSYDHSTGAIVETTLQQNVVFDDHINPALLIRDDGHIVAFYARGGQTNSGYAEWFISDNPLDISSFGQKHTLDQQAVQDVSYPKPFQMSDGEIRWYYRSHEPSTSGKNRENFVVSSDGAESFGSENVLLEWQDGAQWVYSAMAQDGDTIHIGTNDKDGGQDGTPHSIYYLRYDHSTGTYHTADGTQIGTDADRPFTQSDLELVYDDSVSGNDPAWIYDAGVGPNGRPVITFVTYPNYPNGTGANYHWARWTGSQWTITTVVSGAGSQYSDAQPLYTGGIVPADNDPSTVYLSQEINGAYEIQQATTNDGGSTWSFTDITSGSDALNIRPKPVKNYNAEIPVLWMHGYYNNPARQWQTLIQSEVTGRPF
jgi:hypothetical protein